MTAFANKADRNAGHGREKLLLLGAAGQLGQTLQQVLDHNRYEVLALTRQDVDIADETAIVATLNALQPDVIINAAAYTAVDKAESDDLAARAANATGPKFLARWTAANDAWLLQVSTDFVFNGCHYRPYKPDDRTDPLGMYGRTKLEGELHVGYLAPKHSLVLRTSWVYSEFGNNFVKTMLKLMAVKDEIGVVADQIGAPTSTWSLAHCISGMLSTRPSGILHWQDAGVASWYDFAVAIHDDALRLGLLDKAIAVQAITTRDYPTAAKRPPFSVLDCTKTLGMFELRRRHWRHELLDVLDAIKLASGPG